MRAFMVVVLVLWCGWVLGCTRNPPTPATRADEAVDPPDQARAPAPVDTDADGLADGRDACATLPEDMDGFEDTDGCPDADNDRDGLADAQDRCPLHPETFNNFEDGDGCPDRPPPDLAVQGEPASEDPGSDFDRRMEDATAAHVENVLGLQADLMAGLGGQVGGQVGGQAGEVAMEDKNRPTSLRAIKARPMGDMQPRPAETDAPRPVASSGPSPVVAVFDIQDAARKGRLDPNLLEQLTEYLAAQLTERVGYRVVPRDQLQKQLAEQKTESYRQCYDQGCQIALGKAMSAEKSLSTKVLHFGKKCALTAVLYDLKSETTERATTENLAGCTPEDFMQGLQSVADRLAGRR